MKNFWSSKGLITINRRRIGEIHSSCIWERTHLEYIDTTCQSIRKRKSNSLKIGARLEQVLHKRIYLNDQLTLGKCNLKTEWDVRPKISSVGKSVEQLEFSCTAGRNTSWFKNFGKLAVPTRANYMPTFWPSSSTPRYTAYKDECLWAPNDMKRSVPSGSAHPRSIQACLHEIRTGKASLWSQK